MSIIEISTSHMMITTSHMMTTACTSAAEVTVLTTVPYTSTAEGLIDHCMLQHLHLTHPLPEV